MRWCAVYDGRYPSLLFVLNRETGSPMTYSLDGTQYIVVAASGDGNTGRLIAYTLP